MRCATLLTIRMADALIDIFVAAGLSAQKAKETVKNEILAKEFKNNIEKVNVLDENVFPRNVHSAFRDVRQHVHNIHALCVFCAQHILFYTYSSQCNTNICCIIFVF